MMSLPRSALLSPARTAARAVFWWGKSSFFFLSVISSVGAYFAQSIWLSSRSCRVILIAGGFCPSREYSAFSLQSFVVVTMMRKLKVFSRRR
jgi:hypothetical protein